MAAFVAKYAGTKAKSPPSPKPANQGATGQRGATGQSGSRPVAEPATLDLKLIRSDPEGVKAALARRGAAEEVDELLALDARRRELLPRDRGAARAAEPRLRRDRGGKRAGATPRRRSPRCASSRGEIKRLEQELAAVEAEIEELLPRCPTFPTPRRPTATPRRTPRSLREVGEPPEFDFEPRDHLDLGTALGVIDMESAARASGSRFAYLKGDLVLVELALVQFALDRLEPSRASSRSSRPCWCARSRSSGPGFLPTDRAQIYEIAERRPLSWSAPPR